MTCIIGYSHNGKAYVGADSLGSNGWTKAQYDTPKLFEVHGMVIGYTTSYRFGQVLQHHLRELLSNQVDPYKKLVEEYIPHIREILTAHGAKTTDKGVDSGGACVIGYKGAVYELQHDFSVLKPSNGIACVGSGAQVAYGAMLALTTKDSEQRILRALEVTSDAVTSVGGDFVVMAVPS